MVGIVQLSTSKATKAIYTWYTHGIRYQLGAMRSQSVVP